MTKISTLIESVMETGSTKTALEELGATYGDPDNGSVKVSSSSDYRKRGEAKNRRAGKIALAFLEDYADETNEQSSTKEKEVAGEIADIVRANPTAAGGVLAALMSDAQIRTY